MKMTVDQARVKLLSILPRKDLEELSGLERPHTQTRSELVNMCPNEIKISK